MSDRLVKASTEHSWRVWHDIHTLFGDEKNFLSALRLQDEKQSASRSQQEQNRVMEALKFTVPAVKKCNVPQCTLPNCKLITHRMHGSTQSRHNVKTRKKEATMASALRYLELFSQNAQLSPDIIDGFPALPLDEPADQVTKSLFHHFFVSTFDTLALLFRGPSVTDMAEFKGRMLSSALTSKAYCLSLVLASQTAQDLARNSISETERDLKIYDDTLKAFQEQLASIRERPHPLHIELALLVLCGLLLYDGVHVRHMAQKVHWKGLQDLVSLRGGMHCVTLALAYVIHVDRTCAVQFGRYPTYTNGLTQILPMPIPPPNSVRYGSALRRMRATSTTIDPGVIEYCVDASGLVELWEESKTLATLESKRSANPSQECLYYTRDRLDERFAILQAQWASEDGYEKCIVWAARVIEYSCTWSNFVQSISKQLIQRLVDTLQQHDLQLVWTHHSDMLIWILFALATTGCSAESHSWIITCLRQALDVKYDSHVWPQDWRSNEEATVISFVWSRLHCASRFEKVCDELEKRT